MNKLGLEEIIKLNNDFYEYNSESFDASRDRPWEGFLETLKYLRKDSKVLDLGCGNARFLDFLLKNNLNVNYLGMDNSPSFIQKNLQKHPGHQFKTIDILNNLADIQGKFNFIGVFGVTHHIPYFDFRKKWFLELQEKVEIGGVLFLSFWEFKTEKANENYETNFYQRETNDYFLGWKRDFSKVRFCHLYDNTEIEKVKKNFDKCEILEDFYMDNNRYLVLKRRN
jgi:tRNA (uracil-5-)-methyltransferase TRM9